MKKETSNTNLSDAWETNADYWDAKMGDESNRFHREIVRPDTEKLLDVQQGDLVLDAACGNGNFSRRLAELGAEVVAFDYSKRMIENAKKRQAKYLDKIDFAVCDATDYEQIMSLKGDKPFDKAVSNMALMDISNIAPLFEGVYKLLKEDGTFIFSTHHPCFMKPDGLYRTPTEHQGEAIKDQPQLQNYYHRSLQDIINCSLKSCFQVDGFYEGYDVDKLGNHLEIPVIIIVRLRKNAVK